MNELPTWRRLAIWGTPTLFTVATLVVSLIRLELDPVYLVILMGSIAIPFSLVGALIVDRQPQQAVGWVMWAVGACMAFELFVESYGTIDAEGGSVPLGGTAWTLSQFLWFPPIVLGVTLLPLLFPTGRPLSRRWGWFGWIAMLGLGLAVIPAMIYLWIHRVAGMSGPKDGLPTTALIDLFFLVGAVLILAAATVAIISVFVRFRRAIGVERQQLKWFVVGTCFASLGSLATFWAPWRGDINALATLTVPIAIGVAILRYRLFDIDVIINRALVYLLLTASLAVIYLGLVFGFGGVIQSVLDEESSVVTAASTLAVAGLFQPFRSRIQRTVDRHFYRHKYDAARTLDAFSSRLRDETDLMTLQNELQTVVHATMQPAHVSLWLRPMGGRRRGD